MLSKLRIGSELRTLHSKINSYEYILNNRIDKKGKPPSVHFYDCVHNSSTENHTSDK
jgi:hypothetical protein